MSRAWILTILLATGLPAAGQAPASDPPPRTTATEQKPQDAPSTAQENQAGESQEKEKEEEAKKKKGALGRLKDHVKDHFSTGCVGAGTAAGCWGDDKKGKQEGQQNGPDKNPPPPRSTENQDPEFSSSRSTQIDLSPPGQEKQQPQRSKRPDDVQELQHYDPHAAEKDLEVGEYYLKRGNLKAALARFRSALYNKPNDAVATFRLAQTLEKAGQVVEARAFYEKYLQILPKGEFAAESTTALQRLPKPDAGEEEATPSTSAPAETLPSKRSPQS